jgi:hypothetical protein
MRLELATLLNTVWFAHLRGKKVRSITSHSLTLKLENHSITLDQRSTLLQLAGRSILLEHRYPIHKIKVAQKESIKEEVLELTPRT